MWALLTSSMLRARLYCNRNFGPAKKVVRETKIPGKWSAMTIFPCKIWCGLGIMVQVRVQCLITIAVYERIWFSAEGIQ